MAKKSESEKSTFPVPSAPIDKRRTHPAVRPFGALISPEERKEAEEAETHGITIVEEEKATVEVSDEVADGGGK